ncbi:hypothetical protein HU200_009802 [Digitaria exilis]|uniref:RING-type E3 ubiquitin transferase n=1 Tax=Digitaria exilis TaxID=1010633 RepID=A0A835FIR8_9POAL|nr:hypothetical protein HU200_009802 [Digitaria exilis]
MEEPWKDFDFDEDDDSASSGSAAARPESAAVAAYVMAEDADALYCGVCCLPLKPPIFQCDVGHVVCSPCRDKLKDTGKCHECGTATGDYRRCHAMERLLESIRFPCPYAAHGCTAMPAYCHKQSHRQACSHAPWRCPGKGCSFVGSSTVLLDHFTGEHGWPCTTRTRAGKTCRCSIRLSDGFNFLLAELASDGEGGGAATTGRYLLLLNVTRQEVGRAVSVLLVGRKPSAKALKCVLTYSRRLHDASDHQKFLGSHLLQSEINVECWDYLSSGLPGPEDCFQFVVPDFVLGEDKEHAIQIKISVSVHDLE